MKTVSCEITAEDIADGARFSAYNCPVARALSRIFGRPCSCGVAVAHAEGLDSPVSRYEIDLSRELSDFIRAYDLGRKASPGVYKVRAPDELADACSEVPTSLLQ